MFDELKAIANDLDAKGHYDLADEIDHILTEAAKSSKKWMQKAVNPKEKGELHRKLNIAEDKEIPTALLEKKKKQLQEKGKGDKKMSKEDRETLSQIVFALNARKSKK